jgi:thiamine pyrophosphokinase
MTHFVVSWQSQKKVKLKNATNGTTYNFCSTIIVLPQNGTSGHLNMCILKLSTLVFQGDILCTCRGVSSVEDLKYTFENCNLLVTMQRSCTRFVNICLYISFETIFFMIHDSFAIAYSWL